MTAFKVPSSNRKRIDMTKYGGEGYLFVCPPKGIASMQLIDYITQCASKDGITWETDEQLKKLMAETYKMKAMMFNIKLSTFVEEEDGMLRQITDGELAELDMEVLTDIMVAIQEGIKFPLAQTGGKGRK
jgi:hypothetical protein